MSILPSTIWARGGSALRARCRSQALLCWPHLLDHVLDHAPVLEDGVGNLVLVDVRLEVVVLLVLDKEHVGVARGRAAGQGGHHAQVHEPGQRPARLRERALLKLAVIPVRSYLRCLFVIESYFVLPFFVFVFACEMRQNQRGEEEEERAPAPCLAA